MSMTEINLACLKILWEQFRDIPIDNQDRILKSFAVFDMVFPRYTSRFDIWHWFDERCPNNLHDDLMFPKEAVR
jgi:hypothetical protein